jgi:UDP-N-acetylglucosamine diphosphorylase/glucosamine-1-phosphate N-acetyltransferase
MSRPVIVFEDTGYTNLLPLTHTRPACRLRCGIDTLLEKVAAAYPDAPIRIHVRDYLADVCRQEIRDTAVNEFEGPAVLLLNGRCLAPADLATRIAQEGEDAVFTTDGTIVAARLSGARFETARALLSAGPLPADWSLDLKPQALELPIMRYPWDLVHANAGQIEADFARRKLAGQIHGSVHRSAVLDNEARIHVADGAQVAAGAILAAGGGSIYIGPGAKVMPGAVLEGPVAIGPKSTVKMLAKIYEGTSLGEYCKVGGEVEESIFQAYSNKQHDGFLGHAFLGEWINLGADTNNSDLKNNYSTVRVVIDGQTIDSGSLFVGVTMGDHSKTGINTMINTGTVAGVGCNLFGADFPPKSVPSFCWGGAGNLVEHAFEKFVDTARKVMARRDRELTPAHASMLQHVFERTAGERGNAMD